MLIDSRQGVNLTMAEAKEMTSIIVPFLKQGGSPYQILWIHPKLDIFEKTMYSYIEDDAFHESAGISALDLQRQVSRRISKKKAKGYDNRYLQGSEFSAADAMEASGIRHINKDMPILKPYLLKK